jgi:hypothetical protein
MGIPPITTMDFGLAPVSSPKRAQSSGKDYHFLEYHPSNQSDVFLLINYHTKFFSRILVLHLSYHKVH